MKDKVRHKVDYKYKIVFASNLEDLDKQINEIINDGFSFEKVVAAVIHKELSETSI